MCEKLSEAPVLSKNENQNTTKQAMLTITHSAVTETLCFPLLPGLPLPLLGLYQLTSPKMDSNGPGFNFNRQPHNGSPRPTLQNAGLHGTPSHGSYGASLHGPYGNSQHSPYGTPQQHTPYNNGGQHHLPATPRSSSTGTASSNTGPAGDSQQQPRTQSSHTPPVDLSQEPPLDTPASASGTETAQSMSIFVDTILNLWGFGPKEIQLRQYMHGFIQVCHFIHPRQLH